MFAPLSAVVKKRGDQFVVEEGKSFQLVLDPTSEALSVLKERFADKPIAYQAPDAMVVGEAPRLSMVVVRELVPEWDESDRRRLSCATPGLLHGDVPLATFAVEQIGAMVAACRTLELPRLE